MNHLDDDADQSGNERRQQGGRPAEFLVQRIGEVSADGKEGAVRKIHDAEHSEDDRKSDRDQDVEKAQHQAIDGLRQDHIEHGVIRVRSHAQ